PVRNDTPPTESEVRRQEKEARPTECEAFTKQDEGFAIRKAAFQNQPSSFQENRTEVHVVPRSRPTTSVSKRRIVMANTSKNVRRPPIPLARRRGVPALVAPAQPVVKGRTPNPSSPTPPPPLAAVTAAIDDLQTAEHGALTRTKGAVVLRNEKRTALVG